MKTRRTILILEILAILMVLGIFLWQLSTLPSLRVQLRSGLHNGLRSIAEDCATTLNDRFEAAISKSNRLLAHQLSYSRFNPKNSKKWSKIFYPIAAASPLSEGWFLALPEKRSKTFQVFDYKKPSRYRKNTGKIGHFRKNTDLGEDLKKSLNSLLEPKQHIHEYADLRWASAVDSNIVFSYDRTFKKDLLIGYPIFYQGSDSLIGIVFSQVNQWYFEHVFLRDFFLTEFWTGGEERFGLNKRHLQFGLISNNGDRLLFHSIAYGENNFEHLVKLTDFGSSLSDLTVGVGFRDARVSEVADSIYQRNFILITGLFILLIVLLVMIFFSAIRLLRLSRLKTEFVANVSHEIKTPLSSIRLAIDTLKLGRVKTSKQLNTLVVILSRETDRLQYLIHTLLDFSQLESGHKRMKLEEIEIETWLASVETFLKNEGGEMLTVMNRNHFKGNVKVDTMAMKQVFIIFMDNAMKYGGDDPRMHLVIKKKGNWISIGLRDFGVGIRKQDQSIIFDKFVRLGGVDVHTTKGHGIGLSIAKSIIDAMGGKIGVSSRIGEGSTFYVELPIV